MMRKSRYKMLKMPVYRNEHGKSCSECKHIVAEMFRHLYGVVHHEHKIGVPARLEDYKDKPCYEYLAIILERLEAYRGYRDFVKQKYLRTCDLYIEDPGFIVEFDEAQHFTIPREISLSLYPEVLTVGFDRSRWEELCAEIRATDNDKKALYRDEQRA